ncbi:hypothetical protein ABIC45_001248 [Mucilaginibacter rubeus]
MTTVIRRIAEQTILANALAPVETKLKKTDLKYGNQRIKSNLKLIPTNRKQSPSYLKTACLSKNVIFIWIYSK